MKRKKATYFDYQLFGIIVFLVAFGLIMLYSTSSYNAQLEHNDSMFFLKNQLKNTLLGFVAMIIVYKIDYHIYYKWPGIILLCAFVCVALTRTPLGVELNGAKRWINIGFGTMQPGEVAKIGIILFMAGLMCRINRNIDTFRAAVLIAVIGLGLAGEVFVLNDNLSTAIIIVGIVFVMYFVATKKYGLFFVCVMLGVIAYIGSIYIFEHIDYSVVAGKVRLERFLAWRNPEAYEKGKGFQILQGLYAIGSGGLFGKGLGKSIQKLGFIPEAQNDMIFAVICEELGLFGALLVIFIFVILIHRLLLIAGNAPDMFGAMIAVGIMAHIALQVIINIAVVTNAIPNTGVTLPFISYGGTSVIFLLVELGIALNVSKQIVSKEQ